MTKDENGNARKRKDSGSQTVNSKEPISPSLTSTLLFQMTPAIAAASAMLVLIFGGCCSNVRHSKITHIPNVQYQAKLMKQSRFIHWKRLSSKQPDTQEIKREENRNSGAKLI